MNLSNDWLFSAAITFIEFAATWWLQASVLLAAAFVASTALRKRGPAVHSVIYRVALCAVLLCPLTTKALTLCGATHLSLDLRSMLVTDAEPTDTPAIKNDLPLPSTPPTIQPALFDEKAGGKEMELAFEDIQRQDQSAETLVNEDTNAQPLAHEPVEQATLLPAPPILDTPQSTDQLRIITPTVLIALWIAGSVVFVIQLLRDLYNSKLLLRSSVASDEIAEKICRQVASKLNLKIPAIQVTPFLNSPCLLGHWRPTVLLPEETDPSTYPQVFLHELAHLRRGDWLWNLIGRFAVALLWSQPLIWWLQRRTLTVAEEICDDYVIEHGCNRENYLRQLVEIAERSLPLASATGVSMVGFRTKLGSRAIRILDTTRALSTRAGRNLACFIMLAMLAVTVGVAMIEVGKPTIVIASEPTAEVQAASQAGPAEILPAGAFRTFSGRVLGPDGKPRAGIHVYAENNTGNINQGTFQTKTLASTKSNADGSYDLSFKPEDGQNYLIAESAGYGPAALNFESDVYQRILKGESRFDLQLSKERSINGKIVDTEGNAIAGVRVRVVDLAFPKDESTVTDWIANEQPELFAPMKDEGFGMFNDTRITGTSFPVATAMYGISSIVPKDVRTAADGSFVIPNVAENCRVTLYLTGPTIASQIATVIARDMRNVQAYNWLARETNYTHYGASPTIVASPTQPIIGQIVDADSHQPIPNVRVDLGGFIGRGNLFESDSSSNLTDKDGRFAIIGAPIGKKQQFIEITPPADQPYFAFYRELPKSVSGAAPLEFNVQMPRTNWITGTIKDQAGKPMIAKVHYYPFRDNPYATKFTNFNPNIMGQVPDERILTDKNGHFRIQAIPGKGILAAEMSSHDEQSDYELNCSDELLKSVGGIEMRLVFNSWSAISFDALAPIDFSESANEIVQDLTFIKGASRLVNVRDNHGQPMNKLMGLGATSPPNFQYELKLDNSTLTIKSLRKSDKRQVVLLSPDNKLGKAFVVDGDQSDNIDIALEPCSVVTGRVVDEDGKPIRDLTVQTRVHTQYEKDNWARDLKPVQTDADGKFVAQLPIGGHYSVASYLGFASGPNFTVEIRPTSGARYDLGDIKNGTDLNESDTKNLESFTFAGVVNDLQGRPVPGAFVSLIATKRDGERYTDAEAIAETKTDADGKYALAVQGVSSTTHAAPSVVVRSTNSAIVALPVDFDNPARNLGTTTLQEQQILKIRLVDLEGNPLPNVDLDVGSIMPDANQRVGFYPLIGQPKAWFPRLKSDADGQVQIPHVTTTSGVNLHVQASEQLAPQVIAINTGMPLERPADDRSSYRPVVANVSPDQTASIALSPAKIFEGTVLLGDDQTPASNAKIQIWASQQDNGLGSMTTVRGMTDDKGHFRLNPNPGVLYGITAYPPEGAPFQITKLKDLRWTAGPDSKQIKIVLPRGLFARGRILDADSGKPIANASVQYEPSAKNSNNNESIVTGWMGIKQTNQNGEFSIPILPGEGWLLVHSQDRRYILNQKTRFELSSGKIGGERIYAHAFEKLNPSPSQEPAPLEIRLHQGKSVKIIASAPSGQPIAHALAISRLKILAMYEGMWRASDPDQLRNGVIEFEGLESGQTYPIYLLDPEQKLGATVNLTSDQSEVKVTLQPCGSAKARFLDDEGKPLSNREIHLVIVATPGRSRTDRGSGEGPRSDEDFAWNADQTERPERKSNAEGIAVSSVLIPGATYRYFGGGQTTEFVAKSGETYDLGDVTVKEPGAPNATTTKPASDSQFAAVSAPNSEKEAKKPDDILHIHGTVVDVNDKPIAGASVAVLARNGKELTATSTNTNGAFESNLDMSSLPDGTNWLAVPGRGSLSIRSPGFATSWVSVNDLLNDPQPKITLSADDIPIAGQILDLEGRPVAGAKIAIQSLHAPASHDLQAIWTTLLKDVTRINFSIRDFPSLAPIASNLTITRGEVIPDNRGFPFKHFLIQCDAEGRFEIHGVGRNRFLQIDVSGQDIQYTTQIFVQATESIDSFWPPRERPQSMDSSVAKIYPATFHYTAKPSKPISGYVRDAQTGQPISNVRVRGDVEAEGNLAITTTDKDGHYALTGLASEGKLELLAIPVREEPDIAPKHLGASKPIINYSSSQPPVDTNFLLQAGIALRGKVHDQSGSPIRSRIEYLVRPDNPHLKTLKEPLTRWETVDAKEDGSFEIPVLPGPGVLTFWSMVDVDSARQFLKAKASDFVGFTHDNRGLVDLLGGRRALPDRYEAAKFIDFSTNDQPNLDVTLQRIDDVAIASIFDEANTPVESIQIAGRFPDEHTFAQTGFGTSTFALMGMNVQDRHPIAFVDLDNNLATMVYANDDTREPRLSQLRVDKDKKVRITLQKAASATGKLVDANGNPLSNAKLMVYLASKPYNEKRKLELRSLKSSSFSTKEDGSFLIENLPAAGPYMISVQTPSYKGYINAGFDLKSGEAHDLGTIRVNESDLSQTKTSKPVVQIVKTAAAVSDEKTTQSNEALSVHGTVVDTSGKPVSGAAIAYVGPGGINRSSATSNEDGSFDIACDTRKTDSKFSLAAGYYGLLTVRAPGLAISWLNGDELVKNPHPRIVMVADDIPVSGQILDLEGNPLGGAKIDIETISQIDELVSPSIWTALLKSPWSVENAASKIRSIAQANADLKVTQGTLLADDRAEPKNSLYIQTDDQGRFEVRGVGRDRVVKATITGDAIHYAEIHIFTMDSMDEILPSKNDPSPNRDPNLSSINFFPAKFQFLAKPSQPISGYVRDLTTGQPIAGIGVRGKVAAERDEAYDITDANGHYKLTGLATSGKLLIYAVPNRRIDDQWPIYLSAEKPELTFSTNAPPTNLDFQLYKGILATGKLHDQDGKPIIGMVNYFPRTDNPALKACPDKLSRFESGLSKSDGSFKITVFPGPGLLVVGVPKFSQTSKGMFYKRVKSKNLGFDLRPSDYMNPFGQPFQSDNFHAVKFINFDTNEQPELDIPELDIAVESTDGAQANFYDEAGTKINRVYIAGRFPGQNDIPDVGYGAQPVEIIDLNESNRCPAVFIDRKSKLSAIAFGTQDTRLPKFNQIPVDADGTVHVTLQKSGSVSGKLTDASGTPIGGAKLTLSLISKPYNEELNITFPSTKTSEDGSFLIENLPAAGPYIINVESGSLAGYINAGFDLKAGEQLQVGTIDGSHLISPQNITQQ